MTRPNVDFSQLRALVFCREVRSESVGVSLIGVHDTRFSQSFPTAFETELVLYICFEAARAEQMQVQLQVYRPDSTTSELVAELEAQPDDSLVIIAPVSLAPFSFDRPGKYNFGLYVDGVLVGSTKLTIEQVPTSRRAPLIN